MPIEKITYTKEEKIAEIAAAVIAVCSVAGYVVLMSMGRTSGAAVILIVVSLILYTALTFCSVFPQHTNIAMNPEKCSEKNLRMIRHCCIAAKIVLIALLFAATMINS